MTKHHGALTHHQERPAHDQATAAHAEEQSEGDLGAQIQAAEEEARQHYDKLLRVMAEFENFKKRMMKEREDLVRFGNEKLLAELLPALDDMDRVLEHLPVDPSEDVKKFADGVALARRSLGTTLEKFGLKEIPALGEPFDPARHEAIAAVESDSYAPDSIMAVHRTGYWLFDRLLRPAMVTVAKAAEETSKQET
ncbi:MAG: nucleotide exchange factor GrpE [bacterium]